LDPHHRHDARQRRDSRVRDEGCAPARRCDHNRPRRGSGARRHPLYHAAARTLRRDRDLPRVICALQHARRGRQPCAGADQGAGFIRMTEEDPSAAHPAEAAPTGAAAAAAASALPADEVARLTDEIITALKTVYDPEIPADIYELGLIYKVDIAD